MMPEKRPVSINALSVELEERTLLSYGGKIEPYMTQATYMTLCFIKSEVGDEEFEDDGWDYIYVIKEACSEIDSCKEWIEMKIREFDIEDTDSLSEYWLIGDTNSCVFSDINEFLERVQWDWVIDIFQSAWNVDYGKSRLSGGGLLNKFKDFFRKKDDQKEEENLDSYGFDEPIAQTGKDTRSAEEFKKCRDTAKEEVLSYYDRDDFKNIFRDFECRFGALYSEDFYDYYPDEIDAESKEMLGDEWEQSTKLDRVSEFIVSVASHSLYPPEDS